MKTVAILCMLLVAAVLLWDVVNQANHEYDNPPQPVAFIIEALLVCMLVLVSSGFVTNWNP